MPFAAAAAFARLSAARATSAGGVSSTRSPAGTPWGAGERGRVGARSVVSSGSRGSPGSPGSPAAPAGRSEDTGDLPAHDVDACAGELLRHVARHGRGDEDLARARDEVREPVAPAGV